MHTPNLRAEQIFAAALETSDPAERRAYLDRTCAGDEQLRSEVESLLKADEQAGEFLQQTPTVVASAKELSGLTAPLGEKSGTRIGRYKLLEQIGEGGFGVVWMAEQERPVRRRVALKIIKLGMDTREVVARFDAERQALALMDHPNIARVFDGGATDSGRPYFVMELVRGEPITKYCDEHRLNLPERLELYVQVCQAVQHAHQKGVIHRDLKPSNILVAIHDDKPVPKVIDFGIAKATQQPLTEKTLFTRFNQFVGTPAYMSPEQAGLSSLDVDTRSDIYSLGVLLYELLTGRTPFSKEELLAGGYDEICRIIREKEPPKPSTRLSTMSADDRSTIAAQRRVLPEKLGKLVRADLDWIVMKCLEKDRTRRYETATGLAMELERFLGDEPVIARPPSQFYRLQKLVRRNKLAFGAMGVVVAALAIGLGISTYLYLRARAAEQEQSRLRQEAEANEQAARSEADKNRRVANSLLDMLRNTGPWTTLVRDPKFLRELLQQVAERTEQERPAQPEVEAELRHTIGMAYFEIGDLAKAQVNLSEAVRLRRSKFGNEHLLLAESLSQLAASFLNAGHPSQAEPLAREVVSIQRKLYGNSNMEVARSLGLLGLSLSGLGQFAEAEATINEMISIFRHLDGEEGDGMAGALENLSVIKAQRGDYKAAEAVTREALKLRRRISGEYDRRMPGLLTQLGYMLLYLGRVDEAEAEFGRALAVCRKVLGDSRHWQSLDISKTSISCARCRR